MSSLLLVNNLVKNRPDIDELPIQFIHTMDLSVVDTMLHDSPDLVIHRTEVWAVWRPQVGGKKVWRFLTQQFTIARARRGVLVHCPAGTKLLPDTLHIADSSMTSLWRPGAASKKSVTDISRISCFVTTVKLLHALQIYSTFFVKKCMRLHFAR